MFQRWAVWFLLSLVPAAWAQARDWPEWPLPSQTTTNPVAGELILNGLPMQVQALRSVLTSSALETAMRESCEQAGGSFHGVDLASSGLWQCLRRDYSQVLRWKGSGNGVEGVLSTLPLNAQPGTVPPLPLPLPDGSGQTSDLQTRDGASAGRVIQADSNLDLGQLRQWFLDAARAHAWKVDKTLSHTAGALALRKKGESLDIAFVLAAHQQEKIIMIWQNR